MQSNYSHLNLSLHPSPWGLLFHPVDVQTDQGTPLIQHERIMKLEKISKIMKSNH